MARNGPQKPSIELNLVAATLGPVRDRKTLQRRRCAFSTTLVPKSVEIKVLHVSLLALESPVLRQFARDHASVCSRYL